MSSKSQISYIDKPTNEYEAGYQVWVDLLTHNEIMISRYRNKEDKVQIPGGDSLVGDQSSIESQLKRRGWVKKAEQIKVKSEHPVDQLPEQIPSPAPSSSDWKVSNYTPTQDSI